MTRPQAALTLVAMILGLGACSGMSAGPGIEVGRYDVAPMAWDHVAGGQGWTRSALDAMASHGGTLVATVPKDIEAFCPDYAQRSAEERAQFWVGVFSALAKHESTWRANAVGGGNQWFGLTQISPTTARGYGCAAGSGKELLNGRDNLACAIRIAAAQVSRDGILVSDGQSWRGLARDWAPFRSARKRAEMARFTSRQPYCSS